MSKAQLSGVAVLLIVLMRLAAGYHFFSEGMKKLEPGFSSEGFLRSANGPLADKFKAFAPGLHGAYELLQQPRQWDSLTEEEEKANADWRGPYNRHLAKVKRENDKKAKENDKVRKTGKGDLQPYDIPDAEFPPHSSYTPWALAIDKAWQQQYEAAKQHLDVSDEAIKDQADRAYRSTKASLANYFVENQGAIDEYQHELWRLDRLKDGYREKQGTLPFRDERIAEKKSDVSGSPRQWIAGVQAIQDSFQQQLIALAPEDAPALRDELTKAMNPPTKLDRINTIVTWVVLGAGVCLFVGLFTRLAAVVAAGFLLSVLATQPPWVYGSDTTYMYYQLFEIAGLLTLAAIGAGRWLGFDGLLGCCCRFKCKPEKA